MTSSETRGPGPVPAAVLAAERVARVRDSPQGRLELLRSSYAPLPGATPVHLRYRRAALAFMGWQVQRGLLDPLTGSSPGSSWWRAMNERLLRDTCEARLRLLGHPGPASSPSCRVVGPLRGQADAARAGTSPTTSRSSAPTSTTATWPSGRTASSGSSSTSCSCGSCTRMPSSPLHGWRCPGSRRRRRGWAIPRRAMTGIFLSVSRVLPDAYPLDGELDDYIANEHTIGRLLDLGRDRATPR